MYLLSDRETGSASLFAEVTPSLVKGCPIRMKSASGCLLVRNREVSGINGIDLT